MMTVGELYDILITDKNCEMYVVIEDKYVPMSAYYEVYDNVCYFDEACESSIYKVDWRAKAKDIIDAIKKEAQDDCWSGKEFRAENTYQYCEVSFCDKNGNKYEVNSIRKFDDCFLLECE